MIRMRLTARLAAIALVAGTAMFAVGCLRAPVVPPPGMIWTEYDAPLDFEMGHKGKPTQVANMKKGEARTRYLRLFYPALSMGWEDNVIKTAAKDGGIETVHFADYHYLSVLGLFQEVTVTAYGE